MGLLNYKAYAIMVVVKLKINMSEQFPRHTSHEQGSSDIERAERLATSHTEASRVIAGYRGELDSYAAELSLRNAAVLTDRLTPHQFSQLSKRIKNGFLVLAEKAVTHLGVEVDPERHKHETDEAYEYRTTVWGVTHGLQAMVHRGPENPHGGYRKEDEPIIRESVFLASELFAQGVVEATEQGIPTVIETLRYFEGNTEAVQRRAERLPR